ncbi:glycosyltransferase family 4 protein [Cryobacterium ruanii]|uniref:D-inositol 3-phosphate glycosyltransferase n=1 Tax=Cryobacterium ruanii TaxID=1259197 RepID=A0A4R9ANG4_9MICO|nr:glycosyltransferase family 4 protein [Cryobacterium ruanii]TFD66518.1 glycosyltransferase [Cryobacterium ruanii]
MTRGKVLLGCNGIEDANAGMAGTVLEIGRELRARDWSPVYGFAHANVNGRLERQLTYVRLLAASLRERPDAAIISSGDGALVAALHPRLPLIVHSHGLEHQMREASVTHGLPNAFGRGHRYIREPAVAFSSRRADALVVQTNEQVHYAIEHYGALPERVLVIPNAVDDAFFDIPRCQAKAPTVLWIGSWVPRKGIATLPMIFSELRRLMPDARLHLLGTGAAPGDVLSHFAAADRAAITVTPRANRDEVRDALSDAHVGLFTSTFEGFGRAIIETTAAGVPLVSTRVGIAPDVVNPENGVLFEHGDYEAAANALAGYLQNTDSATAHGSAAREVSQRFRWSVVGEQWAELLVRVVNKQNL